MKAKKSLLLSVLLSGLFAASVASANPAAAWVVPAVVGGVLFGAAVTEAHHHCGCGCGDCRHYHHHYGCGCCDEPTSSVSQGSKVVTRDVGNQEPEDAPQQEARIS